MLIGKSNIYSLHHSIWPWEASTIFLSPLVSPVVLNIPIRDVPFSNTKFRFNFEILRRSRFSTG